MKLFLVLCIFAKILCDFNTVQSEDSDVAICGELDICNIVHKPYWGINQVQKLCKCPEGSYCRAKYIPGDEYSLPVNDRTQMKFCSKLIDLEEKLPKCEDGQEAIKVKTLYVIDQVKNVSASLHCICNFDDPVYWAYKSRTGKIVLEDEKLFEVVDNFQCLGNSFE
jgi:hypothetical protein